VFQEFINSLLYKNIFDQTLFIALSQNFDQLDEQQLSILTALLSKQLQNPNDLSLFIQAIYETRKIQYEIDTDCIDICGTGGSGFDRVNTSTLVAFTLASLGIKIAKHGNRAGAGRFGSFDLIEKLDIPIVQSKKQIELSLSELNLALIFAPVQFPIFKYFASGRKALQTVSIFNLVGPLLNPLNPKTQFIGTSYPQFSELIYETGKKLGKETLFVYGAKHGLDDISTASDNYVISSGDYELVKPESFGVQRAGIEQIAVSEISEKVNMANEYINGNLSGPILDLIIVNAAFIYSKLKNMTYKESFKLIKNHVLDKKLADYLKHYKELLNDHS
jgi:anthranilate phosphoribosyltransferase